MQEIVVIETIGYLHYAVFIIKKVIKVIGQNVKNVKMHLKQKCMSITEQMNIILKSLKIRYGFL